MFTKRMSKCIDCLVEFEQTNGKARWCLGCRRKRQLSRNEIWRQNHIQFVRDRKAEKDRTLIGRHKKLKSSFLRVENVPETDMLWHFNFYASLLADDVCFYCLGPLAPAGIGLDRIDNHIGHISSNVIPCCGRCNRIKADDLSFEEMMFLVPVLREIQAKREVNVC